MSALPRRARTESCRRCQVRPDPLIRECPKTTGRLLTELPGSGGPVFLLRVQLARRELSEETGLEAGELTYLGCILASPGFCSEKLHMYLARDLSRAQSHPDDDEFLNVVTMPFEELVQKVMDGTLEDAKTVATVLKTKVLLNL